MSISETAKARILIVDDDDGILQVTRMSLRRVKFNGKRMQVLLADSSKRALEILAKETGIGLMLIDGEMETRTAGLDTCRSIREELGNPDIRIYLRTGKLQMDAEELVAKRVWDIEGHLPKGDTSKDDLVETVLLGLNNYYRRLSDVPEGSEHPSGSSTTAASPSPSGFSSHT